MIQHVCDGQRKIPTVLCSCLAHISILSFHITKSYFSGTCYCLKKIKCSHIPIFFIVACINFNQIAVHISCCLQLICCSVFFFVLTQKPFSSWLCQEIACNLCISFPPSPSHNLHGYSQCRSKVFFENPRYEKGGRSRKRSLPV